MHKYWRHPLLGNGRSPVDAALTKLGKLNAYASVAASAVFDSATSTVAAVCLNFDGSLTYNPTAGGSDKKLYQNTGGLFARLSAISGDKLISLSAGQLTAT